MKKIDSILIISFYFANLVLIVFYLYPGSIFGYILHSNLYSDPKITRDFLVSSNHFYAFISLSTIGILAYYNTKRVNFLINYLIFLSIFLELFHLFIPHRSFELKDLLGNFVGVVVVIIFYKTKIMYEKNK